MRIIKLLIDFSNLPKKLQNKALKSGGLLKFTIRMKNELLEHFKGLVNIQFHFYGGWFEENHSTQDAQILIRQVNADFPQHFKLKSAKKRVISAEIVRNLHAPGLKNYTIKHTVRKRNGLPYFKLQDNFICKNVDCIAKKMDKWARQKECPLMNCDLYDTDVFYKYEQKLVDTMLATDLLYWASHYSKNKTDNDTGLFIVSDGQDMIPPLLLAKLWYKNLGIIRLKSSWETVYDNYLKQQNISLLYFKLI